MRILDVSHYFPPEMGAPSARQLVEKAGAGRFVEPENPQALIEAVRELTADAELRRRMGRAGREYVLRHYDRNRLAGAYLDVLERVRQRERTGP